VACKEQENLSYLCNSLFMASPKTRPADFESLEPPAKRVRTAADTNAEGSGSNIAGNDIEDNLDEEEGAVITEQVQPSDLYLDTVRVAISLVRVVILSPLQINRAVLDFDFEKLCSISLSNINIYGCLVCGKYFQGRGRKSYAYSHSIHEDHHVFINLETTKVCL
jgi:U4/U6.U5 tri-snRNP-associated protein 2